MYLSGFLCVMYFFAYFCQDDREKIKQMNKNGYLKIVSRNKVKEAEKNKTFMIHTLAYIISNSDIMYKIYSIYSIV